VRVAALDTRPAAALEPAPAARGRLPRVGWECRRGMDPVGARAARVLVHAAARPGCQGRPSPRSVRRGRAPRCHLRRDGQRSGAGFDPARIRGRDDAARVANLCEFVSSGGTLVALDSASGCAHVVCPARDRRDGGPFPPRSSTPPASIVRVTLDPSDPLAFGMPREAGAFFNASHAFEVGGRRGRAGDRTGDRGALPRESGWLAPTPAGRS